MGRLRHLIQQRRVQSQNCSPHHVPVKPAGGGLAARCSSDTCPAPEREGAGAPQAQQPAAQQASRPVAAQTPQARETAPTPPAGQDAQPQEKPAWGGLGSWAGRVGKALGIERPEVKPEEKEAIDRMIGLMPELAGQDGKFNRGDLEPIRQSLQPEVRGVVNSEIQRRAQERVDQAGPLARPLVRMGARAHLRKHGDEYRAMGMQQGNQQIREGLDGAFDKMGDRTTARDGDGQRKLSLDDLRRFGQDAQVLDQISRRAQEKGLPKFEFPKGMGAEDLAAIREGRLPPNGVPVFRSKKP